MSAERGLRRTAGLLGALILLGAAPVGALPPAERAAALRSGRVGEDVLDALDAEGRARVIVALSPKEAREARSARPLDRQRLRRAVSAQVARVLARLAPGELRVRRRYASVSALAGELSEPGLRRLLSIPEVERIDIDRPVSVQLGEAIPLVNIDQLYAEGRTGLGIEVAIVDTGVDLDHEDLIGAVVAGQCFCDDGAGGCCPNGDVTMSGVAAGDDGQGHGTTVAGVVASNGTSSSLGAAPDVDLVAVRVIAPSGSGVTSDVIAGVDWVAMNRPDVDVVNISLSFQILYTGVCDDANADTLALVGTLATLRAGGTLTVAASANEGSGTEMPAPACLSDAVSVGAVWDAAVGTVSVLGCTDDSAQDLVACFSNSNGLTDLFAPGVLMNAPKLGGGTRTTGGTSFAAPTVVGCAALLYEAYPVAGPDDLADALRTSGVMVTDDTNGLSFPRLDCATALDALSVRLPAGSSLSRLALIVVLGAGGLLCLARRVA